MSATLVDIVVIWTVIICFQQPLVDGSDCVNALLDDDDAVNHVDARQRLDQLVMVGADTDDIVCGRCHGNGANAASRRQRNPEVVRLVDAGYRFFDLSVVEVDGTFYWRSVDTCRREISRPSLEISNDLRSLATSVARHNSEMFFLRLSVDVEDSAQRETDDSRGSRRAIVGRKLLRIVLREFHFRLVRSSLLSDNGAVVSDVLATGSNVAVYVNKLDAFLLSEGYDVNETESTLQLRELFTNDDRIVKIVHDNERLPRRDDVIERDILHHAIVRPTDSDIEFCSEDCTSDILISLLPVSLTVAGLFIVLYASRLASHPSYCHRMSLPSNLCALLRFPVRMTMVSASEPTATIHRKFNSSTAISFVAAPTVLALALLLLISSTRNADVAAADEETCNDVTSANTQRALSDPAAESVCRWLSNRARRPVNIISYIYPRTSRSCDCICRARRSPLRTAVLRLVSLANAGRLRRRVSLHHAGSPLTGAVGFRSLFVCPPVLFAYVVTSRDEGRVIAWNQLREGESRDFEEAEFPMDANVIVYVGTVWIQWLQVYAANVQQLIEAGQDIYLRGSESRGGVGLAYVSLRRRHSSTNCRTTPVGELLNSTRWDVGITDGQQQTPITNT